MIWDIDQAINRYIFFGNGGANLHTIFSETHQITLKTVLLSSLPSKFGCRHHYYIVICDIDRAIIKYTFFDNGGTNLHRNDT